MQATELLTADEVLAVPARWHALRADGVTASEIAAVLGISTWESPFSLWMRKHGVLPGQPDSPRMSLGRHLEAYVAEQWALRYPDNELIKTGLWRNNDRTWQLATPDRLIGDGEPYALLECKTASTFEGWGLDGSDDIPVAYRAQVLYQLDTLGLQEGHVACLFLLTQEVRCYHLLWDEEECALMRKAAEEFLARDDPPPIDWTASTRDALRELYPKPDEEAVAEVPRLLVRRYRAALRNATAAERRKKEIENLLRAAMGDAGRAVDARTGEPVARRTVYKRASYMVNETTVDRLSAAKVKERENG